MEEVKDIDEQMIADVLDVLVDGKFTPVKC